MRMASSPHDFKLLMQADGRRGTTMDDVAAAEAKRDDAAPVAPAAAPLSAVQ
jgi:twitching motility protein PilT